MSQKLNLPATLVHEVDGVKYTLNGILIDINESANTCTMRFGDQVNSNILIDEVFLNEGILDKIKEFGRSIFNKLTGFVKKFGFIVAIDKDGNESFETLNNPTNLCAMEMPDGVNYGPTEEILQSAKDAGLNIVNKATPEQVLDLSVARDIARITKYWNKIRRRVVESNMPVMDAVMAVNESYKSDPYLKALNEIRSGKNEEGVLNESMPLSIYDLGNHGAPVSANELKSKVYQNILAQLTAPFNLTKGRPAEPKPILIWGSPGIGKSSIIRGAAGILSNETINGRSPRLSILNLQCSQLNSDSFDLPDTIYNLAGEKGATTSPKTWLPFYCPSKYETRTERMLVNQLYNCGIHRISPKRDAQGNLIRLTDEELQQMIEKSKTTGGILFLDEYSRMKPGASSTLMALVGDRKYGDDWVMASGWALVGASNTATDDFIPEDDEEELNKWVIASQQRWEHVFFTPTRNEWLEWARSRNEITGRQNIDELLCDFIENVDISVWYATVEFLTASDSNKQYIHDDSITSSLINALKKHNGYNAAMKGDPLNDLTKDELSAIGTAATDVSSKNRQSMVGWSPRTWEADINTPIFAALKFLLSKGFVQQITDDDDDMLSIEDIQAANNGMTPALKEIYQKLVETNFKELDAVMSEKTVKSYLPTGEVIEQKAKNLSAPKLAKALQGVDEARWMQWTGGFWEKIAQAKDESGRKLDSDRKKNGPNDRFNYFMKWISDVLFAEKFGGKHGKHNIVNSEYEKYKNRQVEITDAEIDSIWKNGIISNNNDVKIQDNLYFKSLEMYAKKPAKAKSFWKANTGKYESKILPRIMDAYPGGWSAFARDMHQDAMTLPTIDVNKYSATDFSKWEAKYTVQLLDGANADFDISNPLPYKSPINPFVPKAKTIFTDDNRKQYAWVLDNSKAAQYLCNVTNWICKVAYQEGSENAISRWSDEVYEHIANDISAVDQQILQDTSKIVARPWSPVFSIMKGWCTYAGWPSDLIHE